MKVRSRKTRRPTANARRRAPNPLRYDPTRTITLRRAFAADLRRRFARLKGRLVRLVVDEDVFGLKPASHDPFTANTSWRFHQEADKVRAFQDWLRAQFAAELTGQSEEELWQRYIEAGFRKGAGRAFDDTRKAQQALAAGDPQKLDFYAGTRDEFLRSAFARPVAVEKVRLLAGRAFDDLEGVTEQMATVMSRTLTDGLVRGASPREVARDLADDVDGIGLTRALTIARSELIRSHAEGQLEALEQLGVEEVGVAVEWSVAGDDQVCPLCAEMEGVVLTLDEARGMIPRHANCRCSFTPANVGEADEGQKKSQAAVAKAVRASQEEGSKDDWGPGQAIARERPESIFNRLWEEHVGRSPDFDEHLYKLHGDESLPPELLAFSRWIANAFCPTGPGGGVDPSCSPEGSGKGGRKEAFERARAEAHAHGKEAGAIEDELAGLSWDHPLIHAVHDALHHAGQDTFFVPSVRYPDIKAMGNTYPKRLENRRDDYRRLDRTAGKALAAYGATAPDNEDARADQGKVMQVLRKALAFARQGLKKLDVVRTLRAGTTTNAADNCGTGAGGFQPGNTCGGKAKADEALDWLRSMGITVKGKAGKGGKKKKTTPQPEVATPSAPASAAGPPAVTAEHIRILTGAIARTARHGTASLVDIRRELHAAGLTSRAHQDAVIERARQEGRVSGQALEGRYGITPEEREASLPDPGTHSRIGHLVLREGGL